MYYSTNNTFPDITLHAPINVVKKQTVYFPILFRTLRGQKVSDENLEKLIKIIYALGCALLYTSFSRSVVIWV